MYFQFGTPKRLSALRISMGDSARIKQNTQIAVIDDKPFSMASTLRNHKFNIVELGDIKLVDQVAEFPIIICDIRGVGQSLGSDLEGAHLIAEVRKAYPDKYLISYSGAQFDIAYNEPLRSADASIAKDAPTEQWVSALERGIETVTDPQKRWIRVRSNLLSRGVDIHDVFNLEQGFINAIEKRDDSKMRATGLPDEAKQVVGAFVRTALVQIIKAILA